MVMQIRGCLKRNLQLRADWNMTLLIRDQRGRTDKEAVMKAQHKFKIVERLKELLQNLHFDAMNKRGAEY